MRIEANKPSFMEGYKITFVPDAKPKSPKPGDTALHEATHGVVAIKTNTEVKSMTIVPGPGYLGLTELTGFNAAAALAPDSMGMSGTGYDRFIAEQMGAFSAGDTGRAVAMSSQKEIRAVAIALEGKKTLSSNEIHMAMDEATKPFPEIGTVFIEKEDGEKREVRAEVRDNIIMPEDLSEFFEEEFYIH